MATATQLAQVRRNIAEPDASNGYTDLDLNARIDAAGGNVDQVSAEIWREKASTYSEMPDITEAGSTRRNSQLATQALSMAKAFAVGPTNILNSSRGATTRQIARP